jgi:hypothetical protein
MKSIVCGFLLFVLLTSAVGITAATDSQYPSSTVEFKDPEGKYTIKFTFPDNDNTPHQYGVGYVKGIGYEMCEIKNREDNVVKILVADTPQRYAWVNIDIQGVNVTDWAVIARDSHYYRFITKAKKNTSNGCKVRVSSPKCIDGICDYPFRLYYLYIDGLNGEVIVKFFLKPQKEIDLVIQEKQERWIDKAKGTYNVSYTLKNIGDGTVSAGHWTSLFVDGVQRETKIVPVDLKPKGRYTDTFKKLLTVSGENDNIKVCADYNNDVKESDETNNCRGNIWEAPLKVEITVPMKNFGVQKGEKVDIVANVKDDLNNMVIGSNINSVVASFTTEKNKMAQKRLHDDGAHNDGGNADGVYANTWTPTKTGDCTITVTAKKTDFKDGVDKVNGIVIAKPVLEIPARFKNVHPYKNERGEDAPVFQRKREEPGFEVTNLTELPGGTELIVAIEEPQGKNKYKLINNLTVSKKSSGTKLCAKWDWSSNGHSRAADVIPIGVYRALAKLINSTDGSTLIASEPKNFYVIFDWEGQGKDAFVTNGNGYQFYAFPSIFFWGYAEAEYRLHQYHPKIWKKPLDDLSIQTYFPIFNVDLANRESVAKSLGGVYVRSNVKYPTSTYYKYGLIQNHLWYDNLKALEAGTGTCTDQAAYLVGVLRAIGIPARMVGCKGTKGVTYDFKKKELGHTFTEVWYAGNWHFFEQTHLGKTKLLTGGIGSTFYAEHGVQFRPAGVGRHNEKYWVTTSNSAPGKDPINIYKWYNYNLDIVDLRFDKPAGYKPGDTMDIEIAVKNTGYLTITNPHLEVWRMTESDYVVPRGDVFGKPLADVNVAGSLAPNQQVTKTVRTVSHLDPMRCIQFIVAKPYTLCNKIKVYTFKKTSRIPGFSISPVYSINVDGVKKTFQRFNGSFFESNVSDEKAYIRDSYEWDGLPVNVELYSEINFGRNYSKTVTTLENPDSESHVYNFSMPIYGFGNAAHVPAIGTITSNTTLNVEASHIITYNQSSDEDINVSVYEFSKEARIKAIEVFEHKGVKLVKADACWNITLSPGSSHKICVYSSTRQGQPGIAGFDFSEIYTILAKEIVDNGDSLMNLKVSAPEEVRVAETIPINVTVFNNGIVEETLNLFVNVSRTPRYSRTPNLIYTDTTSISVLPNTEKTLTYPVYISKDTAATVWDVSVDTDKVITATAAFTVNDAFDLDCVQDLEVVHNEVFPFNTTITNTWDTTVHDVKATIHLFGSFTTLDPEELHIGDLLPNERKTISWRLSTTYGGELPLDVSVTSDDGGYDTISSTITSLSPPELWIPNIITHTDAPDFGTSKTVCMNVTLQNLGLARK